MNVVVKHNKKGHRDAQCPFYWVSLQPVGTHLAKEAGLADKEDALECCCTARRWVNEQPGMSGPALAVNTDKLIFLHEGSRLMPVLCVSVTCVSLQNMLPQSAVTNHADCQCSQEGHVS